MGMPKKKWTSEEETALEAGIAKYGPGKWSTILKDREFVLVLHLRSNIDLKDKWRNMNQFVSQPIRKPKNISAAPKEKLDKESSIQDPPTTLAPSLQKCSSKRPIPRLDNLILEAMSNGKPPHDSKQDKITEYIEVVTTTPVDGLPSGWIKEIITKQYSTHKRSDPYYTDPLSGYIFRSKLDALRYLETGDVEKCAIKPKKKDISGEETDKIEKKLVDQENEVVPPPRTTKTQEDEVVSLPTETQKAEIVPQTKTKIMPRLTKGLESSVVPPSTKSNQPKLVRKRKRQKQMVVVRRKMSERIILNKLKRPAFGEGGPGTSIDKAVNLD